MNLRFWGLVRMYLRSSLGFSLPTRAELRKPKVLLKTLGIGLGILALSADLGFIFVLMDIKTYDALSPFGLQGLVLLNAATMASMLVFVLAFMMALSMSSSSGIEMGFLALPIPPGELLAAKMVLVYVTDALLGLFVMLIALVVYGIKAAPPPLFYLYGLLDALALPLLPLALSYLVVIPMVKASKLFRNKNFVMYLGGFIGIGLSLAINFYIQSAMSGLGSSEGAASLASPDALISRMGRGWPPAWFAWKSLTGAGGLSGLLALLGGLALGVLPCWAVARGLGPAYVRSLQAFGETTAVRGRLTAGRSKRVFVRRPSLLALFLREFRLMNREPMYFINGPFIVILMPLILVVMYFAQGKAIQAQLGSLTSLLSGPGVYLIPAAFGAFLGSSTSIACTAVSRDAKFLPWMLSLPISPMAYFGAKLLHAELYALFGTLVGVGAGALVLGSGPLDLVVAAVLALLFSAALNMGGLWMDSAWPRLSWDNPIAALKQNPNAVVVILVAMASLGGLGALSAALRLGRYAYALIYGGFLLLPILAWILFFPAWAERRYRRIGEC